MYIYTQGTRKTITDIFNVPLTMIYKYIIITQMTCNFSINHVCAIVNEIFIPTACKRRIDTINEDFSIRLFNEYNNMCIVKTSYDAGLIIFFPDYNIYK